MVPQGVFIAADSACAFDQRCFHPTQPWSPAAPPEAGEPSLSGGSLINFPPLAGGIKGGGLNIVSHYLNKEPRLL